MMMGVLLATTLDGDGGPIVMIMGVPIAITSDGDGGPIVQSWPWLGRRSRLVEERQSPR